MKPLQERLNEQLEQAQSFAEPQWQSLSGFLLSTGEHNLEIAHLMALAWSLRTAPQLHVTSTFARQMEHQLLHYFAKSYVHHPGKKRVAILKRLLFFIHRYREQA